MTDKLAEIKARHEHNERALNAFAIHAQPVEIIHADRAWLLAALEAKIAEVERLRKENQELEVCLINARDEIERMRDE